MTSLDQQTIFSERVMKSHAGQICSDILIHCDEYEKAGRRALLFCFVSFCFVLPGKVTVSWNYLTMNLALLEN